MNVRNESTELNVSFNTEKVYPALEDIEVTPKMEEQHFKSDRYGFNNITVRAIEGETLEVTPKKTEQTYSGVFTKVDVNGIEGDSLIIEPTTEEQAYDGLFDRIIVNKIETEETIATLDFSNSEQIEVTPKEGKYLKKVTINKDENLLPENILKGVTIFGVTGTSEGKEDDDYIAINYIESTTTQNISLDVGFTPNTRVVLDFMPTKAKNWQMFATLTHSSSGWDWAIQDNCNGLDIMLNGEQYRGSFAFVDRRMLVDFNKNRVYIDGILHKEFNFTSWDLTDKGYIKLFNDSYMRLYSCKVYENDVLIRDLVPALNQYNKGCLYDIVNKRYYENNSPSSDFICDDGVLEELNYIQSAGNGEYIDTGIIPTSDTEVEIKFKDTDPFLEYERIFSIDKQFGIMRDGKSETNWKVECGDNWGAGDFSMTPTGMRVLKMGKGVITIDGLQTCTYSGTPNTSSTLWLFHGNGTDRNSTIRVYYLKIYENGTLVRDFIPHDENGVACLLDTLTSQIYYNEGEGSITFGTETI